MNDEANSISDKPFKARSSRKNTPKIPKKITEAYLTNSGKFYLERFPASTEQFRRVMSRKIHKSCKAHPEQSMEASLAFLDNVVRKFQSLGFLNDAGYAMGLARSLKNRGWPRNRILMRLKEKGVAPDLIDASLPEAGKSDDLTDALVWIKRKKLGAYALKEKNFDKSLASLGRAGFDYHSASRALKMSKEEIEELLNARSREY